MGLLYHILRWAFGMGLALVFGIMIHMLGVQKPESIVMVATLLWTIWSCWDLLRWLRTTL